MKVKVEMNSYCNTYGLTKDEKVQTSQGDCKDLEEMEVNQEQLKDMIDKCVNIKSIE